MEKIEKKVESKSNRKNIIILLAVFIFIAIIILLVVLNINKNIDYELEDVTEFLYFKIYENEKYGVIDKQGNILVEPKYEMIDIPNPSKAVFIGYFNYDSQKGEYKSEVINDRDEKILTKYEEVLPLMFKDASTDVPYEKSVLKYKENDKYGIIDFQGKRITKAIYDSIESLLYKEGCLLVKQNDKYGVINIKGKQMIEIEYNSISADGYYDEESKYQKAGFVVRKKNEEGYRYGYINSKAEMLLEVEYNEIDRVTEIIEDSVYILAFKNGQAGVYKNKKQIIKHSYEEIEYNKQNELFLVEKNSKQGVINKEGKEILKVEYDYIMISGKNINAKKDDTNISFDINGNEQKTKITLIDTQNSNYYITIDDQEQFGIMDREENIILENEYSYIEHAYENFFIVTKDGKIEVINAQNKQKIISDYNVIQKVENQNIIQAIIQTPYTIEIYNNKMEKVASMEEANLKTEKDYIILSSNTERKYFDKNGNEIKNTEIFNNIEIFAFNENNGKWGFKDKNGNIVVNASYDMVTELNAYGFAGIRKDNKWGVINNKGEIIVEPTYEIEWDNPEFIGPYCKLNFGYGMIYYTKELQ